MKKFNNTILALMSMLTFVSCSNVPARMPCVATLNRTPLSQCQWVVQQDDDLGLCFETPSGLRTFGSSTSILIQLHGVSASSRSPSDNQYLITIAVNVYSKDQWLSEAAFQEKINKDIVDKEWLDFRRWAYSSESSTVSMRERDGGRHYRRSFTTDKGDVVRISAEYISRVPEMIPDDDAAIRRIMLSVHPIEKNRLNSNSSKETQLPEARQ